VKLSDGRIILDRFYAGGDIFAQPAFPGTGDEVSYTLPRLRPHVEIYWRLIDDKSNFLRQPDRNRSDLDVEFRAGFLCAGFLCRENDPNRGEVSDRGPVLARLLKEDWPA
jgi:hypothetical protein